MTIGSATVFKLIKDPTIQYGNRRERIQTVVYSGGAFIPGAVIVGSEYENDEEYVMEVTLDSTNYALVKGYHISNTAVTIVLPMVTLTNCKIALKSSVPSKDNPGFYDVTLATMRE